MTAPLKTNITTRLLKHADGRFGNIDINILQVSFIIYIINALEAPVDITFDHTRKLKETTFIQTFEKCAVVISHHDTLCMKIFDE